MLCHAMDDDLEKRDRTQPCEHPPLPRGILDPAGASARIRIWRYTPSIRFRPFVDHHWIAEWDLLGSAATPQRIIPSPNAHLLVLRGETALFGVVPGLEERMLGGRGRAYGMRFRVGGLRPFLRHPVASLTGRKVSPAMLIGCAESALESSILTPDSHESMISAAESLLDPSLPAPDRNVDFVCSIVAEIRREGGAARVETLAEAFGMSLRAMQRLFREYVGVSPKWVIQRYRLQDAAYRLASDRSTQLAGLATELGYFDQAHLTKDFCRAFGISPAQYQRKQVSTRTSTIDRSSHL